MCTLHDVDENYMEINLWCSRGSWDPHHVERLFEESEKVDHNSTHITVKQWSGFQSTTDPLCADQEGKALRKG